MKTTIYLLAFLACTWQAALAQTPTHNSYPQSGKVILLDFDGHLVQGTAWNGSGDITCAAANLSAADITSIYNRVAEDFRPFTLNITTDSAVYQAAPPDGRMRVVITPSHSWYGTAGGVAYINSFTWGNNTPCFVFSALLNNNIKNIAEATSHEIGHTLGLRHQSAYDPVCNKTSEYNAGNGSGEIGWAPIMGVGYYRNMTLWNYGSNPYGCNYIQDDLSIITGNGNDISFRADDHGGTVGSASLASFSNNIFLLGGIIERPSDVDAIGFTLATDGRLKLEALPYAVAAGGVGANVDLRLELLDSNGVSVAVYNDAERMQAAIDTTLSAGRYTVLIQGFGNAYAPNYAVLGSYTVRSEFMSTTPLPLRKLQLRGSTQNKTHVLNWEVVADERIVSQLVEASSDGRTFNTIASVAANNSSFSRQVSDGEVKYYRLKVTFDNNRTYTSNTVVLRGDGNNRPTLTGNSVQSNLIVNSPSRSQYVVFDVEGRRLIGGLLNQGFNQIQLPASAPGLYFIRFGDGAMLHTERFRKE